MSICAGRLFPVLTSSYIVSAAVCEYLRFSPVYVCQIPFEIFSASSAPVQICWPFHATTVAVPVSWQNGSSNCAETTALRRRAFVTKPFASATSRYFVSSLPVWNGFEYVNPFFTGDFGAVFFADFFFVAIGVSSSVEVSERRLRRL